LSQHDLAGIGALLTKPFELTDLMECVSRVSGDEAPASIRWNVLVVDDDATFTYTMKRSFEGAGATVTATTSGEEAIRAVKSQQFDLIVVDLLLGKMLGVDILDEAAKYAPGMMRVAVSGSDDAIAALRADVAHAAYRKPVDFPTIAHVLAAAVKRN
jgi:CheY-like chemotaxis protein